MIRTKKPQTISPMKIRSILLLVFLLLTNFIFAQTITFVSANTNKPLPKVSVFGKDGDLLGISNIDGMIDRSLITKDQENFQLIYDNISLKTLSYEDFSDPIIKLNDRTKDIEAVTIKKGKGAKYMIIKGNFTSYVTLNKKLNSYADGIVTYVFDLKSHKLKSANVQQYRIYNLKDPKNEKKLTATWDYKSFLQIPDLKKIGNLEKYENKNTVIKELKGSDRDQVEISGEFLKEKEFALFGYRLYDITNVLNISFEKDSKKQLRDLQEYNQVSAIKIRHKSEPAYNQIMYHQNFYPTEIDLADEKNIGDVKFDKDKSNFTEKYWENTSFPDLQLIFSSFFKEDLVLK